MSIKSQIKKRLEQLGASTAETRDLASAALLKLDDPDAIPALVEALPTTTGRARREVLRALGRFGPLAHAAVPGLIELLTQSVLYTSYRVRDLVAQTLGEIGEAAVTPLIGLLSHDDPHLKRRAAMTLAKIGDDRAISPILRLFLASRPFQPYAVRKILAAALHHFGAYEQALAQLQEAMEEARRVRHWNDIHRFHESFRALGEGAPEPELMLPGDAIPIRWGALDGISARRRKEAIPTLMALAFPEAEANASDWIAKLGELKATEAIPQLCDVASRAKDPSRSAAIGALGAIKDAKALPTLLAIARDEENISHRVEAFRALSIIGGFEVTQTLLSFAAPGHAEPVAAAASTALFLLPRHKLAPEARFALLRELLSHPVSPVVWRFLCAYLSRWPERDDKQVAIDYATQHIADLPDKDRLVPHEWWIGLIPKYPNKRPESAWSLARHLTLMAITSDDDELHARLAREELRGITHLTYETDRRHGIAESELDVLIAAPGLSGVRHLQLKQILVPKALELVLSEPFFRQLDTLTLPKGKQASDIGKHMENMDVKVLDG